MTTYRYLFADALTGILLEDLPVDCDSFSQGLNDAGKWSGSLPLGDLGDRDWQTATIPNRTCVYVLRDHTRIVWGGILMQRRANDTGTRALLSAETLEGWLSRQCVEADLTYTGADLFDIVRGTLNHVQAQTGGNMRITAPATMAGQTTTVTYKGDERKKILQIWQELAATDPGFEFYIEVGRDAAGVFTHTLRLGAPRLNDTLSPIVATYIAGAQPAASNAMSYTWDEDGTDYANVVFGIGKGSSGAPLIVSATGADLSDGYPRFPAEVRATDEDNTARLTAQVTEELAARDTDYVLPTVELRGDADPPFGEYQLGQPCRLRATSLYHPAAASGAPGIDVTRRINGWTVKPAQAGRQESVTLPLGRA
jgi:hypothetical protein